MARHGYLILENGDVFPGISFGAELDVKGEVVFNTGMTGYPEGFTDPSYCGQILTCTYPLIGNYGVPPQNLLESKRMQIAGLIVSSYIEDNNHWQSVRNLSSWLKSQGIPAISGIDTRTLTKILREFGVMKGIITFKVPTKVGIFYDINRDNLATKVSCRKPYVYGKGRFKVLLFDCGLKYSQIKLLLKHNTTIIQVPWDFDPFDQKNKIKFDAIMISNGPGDPKMVGRTIEHVKQALAAKIPTLGICLGHQILALSAGADTYKMKYGHRSQNQPVKDELTGRCFITTQNHGYAVKRESLLSGWVPWFTNLNDNTNEGIRHIRMPFFSTQFHPEATPGPTDTEWIFSYFIKEAKKWLKMT